MTKIKCHKCGYIWNSESELFFVTCPSCLKKTFTKNKVTMPEDKKGDKRDKSQ